MTNAKNSFGTNFKSPLIIKNLEYFINVFNNSITYILKLKIDEISVSQHRRPTFALRFGIISGIISIIFLRCICIFLCTKCIPFFISKHLVSMSTSMSMKCDCMSVIYNK